MAEQKMRQRRSRYNVHPRWMTFKRILLLTFLAIFTIGGVFAYRTVSALAKVFHENQLSAAIGLLTGSNGSDIQNSANNNTPVNVALYGYGGSGHDGSWLSDSIMVVQIQPQSNGPAQVAEMSVPRDLYTQIQLAN